MTRVATERAWAIRLPVANARIAQVGAGRQAQHGKEGRECRFVSAIKGAHDERIYPQVSQGVGQLFSLGLPLRHAND